MASNKSSSPFEGPGEIEEPALIVYKIKPHSSSRSSTPRSSPRVSPVLERKQLSSRENTHEYGKQHCLASSASKTKTQKSNSETEEKSSLPCTRSDFVQKDSRPLTTTSKEISKDVFVNSVPQSLLSDSASYNDNSRYRASVENSNSKILSQQEHEVAGKQQERCTGSKHGASEKTFSGIGNCECNVPYEDSSHLVTGVTCKDVDKEREAVNKCVHKTTSVHTSDMLDSTAYSQNHDVTPKLNKMPDDSKSKQILARISEDHPVLSQCKQVPESSSRSKKRQEEVKKHFVDWKVGGSPSSASSASLGDLNHLR